MSLLVHGGCLDGRPSRLHIFWIVRLTVQQALPAEFLKQLVLQVKPTIHESNLTVRDSAIACPLPKLAIGDVKAVAQKVGLESLHGTSDNLPSVFGLQKKIQGQVPANPEEMLSTFIKGVIHLPHSVDALEDDGVPSIRFGRVHVVDNIHRTGSLELVASMPKSRRTL